MITLSTGVWPAMITPFNADRSIDWPGVDAVTDWLIDSNVAGIFAVGLSSEMFALSDDERLTIAQRIVDRANGRVPVVASGTFGGPLEQQADFIKHMADTGVASVTILASAIAAETDDESVWCGNLEKLLTLTGDIPLALYECPAPYHRLIPPESLHWAAQTGRFSLLKQTSRSLDDIQAKVDATEGTPLQVFNADATTLLVSLQLGAKGYCGIAANYYPDLVAWLCANYAAEPEKAAQLQAFLTVIDGVAHTKYPVAAKVYQQMVGLDILPVSRVSDVQLEAYDRRVLESLAAQVTARRQIINQ